MKVRFIVSTITLALTLAVLPGGAAAGLTDNQKCLDGKHKATGKHAVCLLKVLARSVGEVPDNARCDEGLTDAFASLEAKYGSRCSTLGDAAAILARNQTIVDGLDAAIDASGAIGPEALACALTRLKAAGRRVTCGAKAQGLLIKKNLFARELTTCDAKLEAAFAKTAAGGACAGPATAAGVAGIIEAGFAQVEADLANLDTDDFARAGSFKASRTSLTFVDESRGTDANNGFPALPQRTLAAEVHYPSRSATSGAPLHDEGGPFPVIIRAHGLGGFRLDSNDLVRHLASHGYIVVSPDFPLSNLSTQGGATLLDLDEQVVDVGFLITQVLALNEVPGGPFEGKIDVERIGVIGHSLGGATVLGAAFHSTLRDPRIDAVVAMAPLACIYQETFFDGGGTSPLMILAGDADMVTGYTSNQLDVFGRANAEKYLVTLAGGTHIGFANDFLNNDALNGDEELACPTLVPPGADRPYMPDFNIPPDFMGGAAAGVDTTGSTCEPICPPQPATWMAWERQTRLELAAALAMFEKVLRGDVSADRLITGRLDAENDDVSLAYER